MKRTALYKTRLHAARSLCREYFQSLGGGWFLNPANGQKFHGLFDIAVIAERRGFMHPFGCEPYSNRGRYTLVHEIVGLCMSQFKR